MPYQSNFGATFANLASRHGQTIAAYQSQLGAINARKWQTLADLPMQFMQAREQDKQRKLQEEYLAMQQRYQKLQIDAAEQQKADRLAEINTNDKVDYYLNMADGDLAKAVTFAADAGDHRISYSLQDELRQDHVGAAQELGQRQSVFGPHFNSIYNNWKAKTSADKPFTEEDYESGLQPLLAAGFKRENLPEYSQVQGWSESQWVNYMTNRGENIQDAMNTEAGAAQEAATVEAAKLQVFNLARETNGDGEWFDTQVQQYAAIHNDPEVKQAILEYGENMRKPEVWSVFERKAEELAASQTEARPSPATRSELEALAIQYRIDGSPEAIAKAERIEGALRQTKDALNAEDSQSALQELAIKGLNGLREAVSSAEESSVRAGAEVGFYEFKAPLDVLATREATGTLGIENRDTTLERINAHLVAQGIDPEDADIPSMFEVVPNPEDPTGSWIVVPREDAQKMRQGGMHLPRFSMSMQYLSGIQALMSGLAALGVPE